MALHVQVLYWIKLKSYVQSICRLIKPLVGTRCWLDRIRIICTLICLTTTSWIKSFSRNKPSDFSVHSRRSHREVPLPTLNLNHITITQQKRNNYSYSEQKCHTYRCKHVSRFLFEDLYHIISELNLWYFFLRTNNKWSK